MASPLPGENTLRSPLFRFLILIFHTPRTRDVIRLAACIVQEKDSRMVNMPEDSDGLRGVETFCH